MTFSKVKGSKTYLPKKNSSKFKYDLPKTLDPSLYFQVRPMDWLNKLMALRKFKMHNLDNFQAFQSDIAYAHQIEECTKRMNSCNMQSEVIQQVVAVVILYFKNVVSFHVY